MSKVAKLAPETDAKAIERLRDQHLSAVNAGDADAFLRTITDDAVFMPPHQPAVSGRENIRSWVSRSFFDPYRIQLTSSHAEVEISNDVAIVRGPYSLVLTPKAGGPVIEESGKFMDILKRQSEGSWKYARLMWNSDKSLPDADINAINHLLARFLIAFNGADVNTAVGTYTEEAVLMPPNEPPVTGQDAIRQWMRNFIEQAGPKLGAASEEIRVSGDLAMQRGIYSLTATGKDGKPVQDSGKWMTLLERQPDGGFRIARDIWNSDRVPPTAATK